MPISRQIGKTIASLTKASPDAQYLINRNPRNLEKMRIAYKPVGYHLEKPGRSFWHKLELISTGRYITARVIHFERDSILEASTSEWAIKKQLYKTNDTSAYVNLAKVFAQRCLETGLTEMRCDIQYVPNGKVDKFLKQVQEGGVVLKEGERFMPHRPWNMDRPEKQWEVTED